MNGKDCLLKYEKTAKKEPETRRNEDECHYSR